MTRLHGRENQGYKSPYAGDTGLEYLGGVNAITRVLKSGRGRHERGVRDRSRAVEAGSETCCVAAVADGGRSQGMNAGGL